MNIEQDRRSLPRLNIGKLNYEAVMKVMSRDEPFTPWESLSIIDHAALASAAMAVVDAVNAVKQQDKAKLGD